MGGASRPLLTRCSRVWLLQHSVSGCTLPGPPGLRQTGACGRGLARHHARPSPGPWAGRRASEEGGGPWAGRRLPTPVMLGGT